VADIAKLSVGREDYCVREVANNREEHLLATKSHQAGGPAGAAADQTDVALGAVIGKRGLCK